MEELYRKYYSFLENTPLEFERSLTDQVDWSSRGIAIVGARGTGKSTMLLQKLSKSDKNSVYVTADDLAFQEITLYDFASDFVMNGGKQLVIDEVHKYTNWQQEVKNIYDTFQNLQIIISGSSIVELAKSSVDLSRRILNYELKELSFREFIALHKNIELPILDLTDILKNHVNLVKEIKSSLSHPVEEYKNYLEFGAYPFFTEGENSAIIRVQQIINLILDYDLPSVKEIEHQTQDKLKKLLYLISQEVPYKPNISKLSKQIHTSRSKSLELIHLLNQSRLIHSLKTSSRGNSILNKPDKLFLRNPTIINALAHGRQKEGNIRETFFLSQLKNAGYSVHYSKNGDFEIDDYIFEVGGKNKTRKQIKNIPNSYIAADNIEYGYQTKIPLWLFGFLY